MTIVLVANIRPVTIMPVHTQFLSQRTEPNTDKTNEKSANLRSHSIGADAIQNPKRLTSDDFAIPVLSISHAW